MIEIYTPGAARRFIRRRARGLAALSYAAGDRFMRAAGAPRIAGSSEDLAQQFPVRVRQVLGIGSTGVVSHDATLSGDGSTASPLSVLGALSTTPLVVRGLDLHVVSNAASIGYTYPTGTKAGDIVLVLQNGSAFTTGTPAPYDTIVTETGTGLHDWLIGHPVFGFETGAATLTGTGIFTGMLASIGPVSGSGIIVLDSTATAINLTDARIVYADAASIAWPPQAFVTSIANDLIVLMVEHAGGATLSTASAGWNTVSGTASSMGCFWTTVAALGGSVPSITITDSGGTSSKSWAVYGLCFAPLGN